MKSYLTQKIQRCKMNNVFREWVKVLAGVSAFLYLQICDLENYADGSTLHTSDKSILETATRGVLLEKMF